MTALLTALACMWPWTSLELAWDAAENATGYELVASGKGIVATVTEPRAVVPCYAGETIWVVTALRGDERVQSVPSDPMRCLMMEPGKPWSMTEMSPALIAFRERHPTCVAR